jgi:hypothetical protein
MNFGHTHTIPCADIMEKLEVSNFIAKTLVSSPAFDRVAEALPFISEQASREYFIKMNSKFVRI